MRKLQTAIVLVILSLAACKRSESEPANFAPKPAPTWNLEAIDGSKLRSADFAGKVQLINFWATWCPPCVAEIPGLIELQKRHEKDGLVIVGISLDQNGPEVVKSFVQKKQINYPVALASGGVESGFGEFDGIPTTFIVDRHGTIRAMHVGYASIEQFEKLVKPFLDER
jgi:thiol-disulfide isomerase/thioredoxin